MPELAARGSAATVEAQAKVNLRLRVIAREASGFHQLETLFLRIALADTVRVRITRAARSLDVEGVPDGVTLGPVERNLAWRAAAAYADTSGWPAGFALEIVKRIPVGGGLGGGSADAGAVLRLLDALAPAPLPPARLLQIAAGLGADVPFLATPHPYVLAWGRGERMLPLPPPPVRRLAVVVPPFGVNTAEAYRWLAAARSGTAGDAGPALLDLAALGDWATLAPLATNDFEPVVAARHPEIAAIVDRLRARGCPIALMSGSGSVVIGVLPEGVRGADAPPGAGTVGGRVVGSTTASDVEPVRPLD